MDVLLIFRVGFKSTPLALHTERQIILRSVFMLGLACPVRPSVACEHVWASRMAVFGWGLTCWLQIGLLSSPFHFSVSNDPLYISVHIGFNSKRIINNIISFMVFLKRSCFYFHFEKNKQTTDRMNNFFFCLFCPEIRKLFVRKLLKLKNVWLSCNENIMFSFK